MPNDELYSNALSSFSPQQAPNFGFNSYVRYYIAGVTTTAGQVCYIDNTNTAWLARADSAANCSGILGISYGGAAGQQTTFLCLGYFNNSYGFAVGQPVYLSDSVWGGLQQNPPPNPTSITRSVGYTSSYGVLSFNLGGLGVMPGPTGATGPNTVSGTTTTTLSGILNGNGSNVGSISGISSQFVKGDGTLDSSTYLTVGAASGSYAPLVSPAFTGTPTAPTQTTTDNSTAIATDAYVQNNLSAHLGSANTWTSLQTFASGITIPAGQPLNFATGGSGTYPFTFVTSRTKHLIWYYDFLTASINGVNVMQLFYNEQSGFVTVTFGAIQCSNGMQNSAPTTVVNGSTSGTMTCMMPEIGTYKKVIIYCNALVGTASYTFPANFPLGGTANPPAIVTTNQLPASMVTFTEPANTGCTITGTGQTGYIIIEGM